MSVCADSAPFIAIVLADCTEDSCSLPDSHRTEIRGQLQQVVAQVEPVDTVGHRYFVAVPLVVGKRQPVVADLELEHRMVELHRRERVGNYSRHWIEQAVAGRNRLVVAHNRIVIAVDMVVWRAVAVVRVPLVGDRWLGHVVVVGDHSELSGSFGLMDAEMMGMGLVDSLHCAGMLAVVKTGK